MDTRPLVSICCITYNHARYITDAIESFLAQRGMSSFEIVVSDDASTDGTAEILKSYAKRYPDLFRIILAERNEGVWSNFTRCLQAARGEFIAYCDGDDYFIYPNKISEQIDALYANPTCSFSFHDVLIVDESGLSLHKHSKGRRSEHFETGIVKNRTIAGAPLIVAHANSLVFRRDHLDHSYFDALRNATGGDYQLLLLLCSHGDGFYINKPLTAYRTNPDSISHRRRMSRKTLDEIKNTHEKMNNYFQRSFINEIKNNYIGHRMNFLESHFHHNLTSRSYIKAFTFFFAMCFCSKKSQYSFGDLLWILKTSLKQHFTQQHIY